MAGAPAVESGAVRSEDAATELVGWAAYTRWGWPVFQHRNLIQLSLDGGTAVIAIPIPLCIRVTQILTARHCCPAVLAHPYTPSHRMVLVGERFSAPLPWPSGVYRVNSPLMLPPTRTLDGPITWVQPPSKDSLRLFREVDVFGAVRTALSE